MIGKLKYPWGNYIEVYCTISFEILEKLRSIHRYGKIQGNINFKVLVVAVLIFSVHIVLSVFLDLKIS